MSKNKDEEERKLVDVKGHLKLLEEPMLPLGDASAIICFALVGKMSHGSSFPVLKVAAPFLASWFLLSPLLGAYSGRLPESRNETALSAVLPWAAAIPAGVVLRGMLRGGSMPAAQFYAISLGVTGVLIGTWRLAYGQIRKSA